MTFRRMAHVAGVALGVLALDGPALAAQRLKVQVPIPELEAVAARDSADGVAQYNLGLGYWSKKRLDDAEAAFKRALVLDPRLAPAHVALAYLPYARRGKLWSEVLYGDVAKESEPVIEESDRHYRAAFLIDPLVDLRIVAAVTPGKALIFDLSPAWAEFYDLLYRGFDEFNEGKYDQALARFNNLVHEMDWDIHPKDMPNSVLWYRGLTLGQLQRWEEARADFQMLLDRSVDKEASDSLTYLPMRTNEYRYMLAYINQRGSRFDPAMELYRDAAAADLGLYMAHVQMANIFEARRQYAEAIEERRRAIAANPDDATLLRDLGLTLGKAGRMNEALEPLGQAAQLLPTDPATHLYTGLAYSELGQAQKAKPEFERFLALAPGRLSRQIEIARTKLAGIP